VDRLLAVNHGTKRSEFTYDGESRRVRIVEKESGVTVRDARLFWAGTAIIEERLSTGQVNRFFGDSEQHNGTARYVTRDHLGSVREVSDTSGAVVARNDFDPYGRLVRVAGTEDSRFGFTGHYAHSPTQLALTLYRAYDPNAGRWLSTDPIREAGGVNLFAYSGNNPINFIDPLGLSWQTFVEGLQKGAVTGVAIAAVIAMLPAAVLASPVVAAIGAFLGVAGAVALIATLVYLYLNDCQDEIDRILGEMLGGFGGGLLGAAIGRGIRGLLSTLPKIPVPLSPSGKTYATPPINWGQQEKHFPGHNSYGGGRSPMTANPEELAKMAGTGQQVGHVPVGQPGFKERVDFSPRIIGSYSDGAGNLTPTSKGMIH